MRSADVRTFEMHDAQVRGERLHLFSARMSRAVSASYVIGCTACFTFRSMAEVSRLLSPNNRHTGTERKIAESHRVCSLFLTEAVSSLHVASVLRCVELECQHFIGETLLHVESAIAVRHLLFLMVRASGIILRREVM
jgi:hypothetical protein